MKIRKTKKRLGRLQQMIRLEPLGTERYWRLMAAAMVEQAKMEPSLKSVIYRDGKGGRLLSIMAKPYVL